MKKVLVGMSGGVDSSVAAAVLKDKGYDVTGATLCFYKDENVESLDERDAAEVCKRLSINHIIADKREVFKEKVIKNFIESYEKGETPNPCVVCNRFVKIAEMITEARKRDIPFIATGHYSKIEKVGDRYLLFRPTDALKDQTYVLYKLTQEQLSKTLTPLADLSKEEVREIAKKVVPNVADRPDSQDICFIKDTDYADFIEKYTGKISEKGKFLWTDGSVVGQHNGFIRYTVGQRKGLGIALGKPVFVTDKIYESKDIVLGDESELFKKRVYVKDLNFIPFEKLDGSMEITAKLRYRHKEAKAKLSMIDSNTALLEFDQSQRAPAKGQSAVFYDGNIVIGGGTII